VLCKEDVTIAECRLPIADWQVTNGNDKKPKGFGIAGFQAKSAIGNWKSEIVKRNWQLEIGNN